MSYLYTQFDILRKHAFYQKSYTGSEQPKPVRTISPVSPKRRFKVKKTPNTTEKPEKTKKKVAPKVRVFQSSVEELDYRHKTRVDRPRPWKDTSTKTTNKPEHIQIFYEKTIPTSYNGDPHLAMKSRRYVTNTKYGDIYEIRANRPRKAVKSPQPRKWLWEEEFMLWNGCRTKYLEEMGTKHKPRVANSTTDTPSSGSTSTTPRLLRPGSLPSIQDKPQNKNRPNAELYVSFHYHRLERTRRRSAAIVIQKIYRGWHIRSFMKRLKKKAMFDHGRTWPRFLREYKELVIRIQSRYGIKTSSCQINLKQIDLFMDKKKLYEKVFREVATDDKLHKGDLMEYFNKCDLWPTQSDINKSFDTVFKGSRNTAEIVFLLDCSTSTGLVGFYSIIKFVRDVIINLDIGADRTRVGIIPYNEEVFNSFGIDQFTNKQDILEAVSLLFVTYMLKIRHGLTRTDLALIRMHEMFQKSRPGVQQMGIVISECQSTEPKMTLREAKLVQNSGVEIFTLGVGPKVDMNELLQIATSPEHAYKVMDPRSLNHIQRQIEKSFCLAACGFCQLLIPRILKHGFLMHEALEILWTAYPPAATSIGPSKVLQRFVLDSQHSLNQSECLEIVLTAYPPEACSLGHIQISRWIRPVIDGTEAWSLLDDDMMHSTGMKACLRLVIQSKLERNGYITVPSDVKEGVENLTNETEVMRIVEKYIRDQMNENKIST